MKKFSIRRINCREGCIEAIQTDGSKAPIQNLPYEACLQFIQENQEEVKIFKIATTGTRKNSIRHLFTCIYCSDEEEAKTIFHSDYDLMVQQSGNIRRMELCTGDWKVIDTIIKE